MKIARKTLAKFGYELNKLPPRLDKNGKKFPTSGLTIELFGSSGVGKSYIFKCIEKELQKGWYFRGQISSKELKRKKSFNLLNNRQEDIVSYVLQQKLEI